MLSVLRMFVILASVLGAMCAQAEDQKSEKLFVASPLTKPKEFTPGIEGPACDAAGNIFAVNFKEQRTIGRVTPEGKAEVYVTLPGKSTGNGIRFGRDGFMYIADYVGHNILKADPRTRKISVFAHEERMSQPNDLAIGPDGVLYASDPNWGKGSGQLWRIGRRGKVTRLAEKLGTTNGIEVSPDGKTLYVNESKQRNIWAFDITADTLKGKRLLKQFPDHGFDGMRCDVDGNLYVTRYGKGTVVKLSPGGKVLREIDVLGARPSNICFGGPDGRTAYVTEVEHQRLVQFRVDRPGLAWQRWPANSADPPRQTDVFVGGKGGYHTYRIPALVTANARALLAFCEGRKTSRSDDGDNDMLLRRSTDAGKTWQPTQLVHEEGGDSVITIGNPCPVVDRTTGVIWLLMTRENDRILITSSKDDGLTWAKPTDITQQVKKPAWGWYATGPGVGIQLRLGRYKGRLVIPCDHRKTRDRGGPSSSHVIYSDDHGRTWKLGGPVGDHSNECQVAEVSDGTLLINARNHYGRSGKRPDLAKRRIIATSRDGGETWSEPKLDEALIEPQCQASLLRYPRTSDDGSAWLLFSNPASKSGREKMTIRLSHDNGKTWPVSKLIHQGSAAYSCLTVLPDGRVGLLYERDGSTRITFAVFALPWLKKP